MIETLKASRNDVVTFIESFVRDSESGKLFELFDYQKTALTKAFERDEQNRLEFWEIFFSWPRKDGKTEPIGTGIAEWFLYTRSGISIKVISPQSREHAEGIFANKLKRSIQSSPFFEPMTTITKNVIEVPSLGNRLTILPTEDVAQLGWEDSLILFDEIGALRSWQYDLYYNLQSGQGALIGKGKDALLVGISTFGDETEGHPLFDAYERSNKKTDKRLYFNYSDKNQNPQVTQEYLNRQEAVLPKPVFLKFHRNQPGAKSGTAINEDDFQAIICHDLKRLPKTTERIRVGLDVGVTNDYAAFAGVASVNNIIQLRNLEYMEPTKDHPVDLNNFFGRIREYLFDNRGFASLSGDPWEWRQEYQKLLSFYTEESNRIRQFIFTEANRKKLFKNFISLIKNRQFEIYWYENSETLQLFKKQLLGLSIDSNWRVTNGRHGDDLVVATAIAALDAMEDIYLEWKYAEKKPTAFQLQMEREEREFQNRMSSSNDLIPEDWLSTEELQRKRFQQDSIDPSMDGSDDSSFYDDTFGTDWY